MASPVARPSVPLAPPLPPDALSVGPLTDLQAAGHVTLQGPGGPIAVFSTGDTARAVDNRCPHMGFPLDRGSVRDGILTCHWHEARFDLASGCTFDLFADDVPRYDTWIVDGDVFVACRPSREPGVSHHSRRLRKGIELDVPLVQAKSLLGLLDLDADLETIAKAVVDYASDQLRDYGEGLVRLGCVANLFHHLSRETAYLALLYAIRRIAAETSNSPARKHRDPLGDFGHDVATLSRWLQQWVRTRHADASERTLLTAAGSAPHALADLVCGAATERLYANAGHVLDASNKAIEMIERLGAESATRLVPLLVRALTQTRGEEESTTWHHPVPIVEPMRELEARLDEVLAAGAAARAACEAPEDDGALLPVLLGDDPLEILASLENALRAGAPAEKVARRVAHAASLRLARFATSNEVTDWFGPQHALNFANAAHQTICRSVTPETVRALFHAAIAVYVDRYLNVPPARLPSETKPRDDLPSDAEGLRTRLLDLLDSRSEIDAAARIVSRWVALELPRSVLIDTLTFAAVREDIDFHALQVIEASARQCDAWGSGPEIEHVLVGAVRNLAAHCPTRRAGLQTATIAQRLHRGDRVFEAAEA